MRLSQSKNIESDQSAPASPFFNKESKQFFSGDSIPFFAKPDIQRKPADKDFGNTNQKENNIANNLVQGLSAPVSGGSQHTNNVTIQRKCADCKKEEEQEQKKGNFSVQMKEDDSADSPALPVSAATGFIVDDNSIPGPGQMRKSSFLARLKAEVCESVNSALAGTAFTADNCPYLQAAFDRHQDVGPAQIEALILRYCPSAIGQNAEGIIQQMKIKVYAAALQWVMNGGDLSEATKILNGIEGNIGAVVASIGGGVGSIAGSIASGIGAAAGSVASGIGSAAGSVASGIGSVAGSVASGIGAVAGSVASGVGSVAGSVVSGFGSVADSVVSGAGAAAKGVGSVAGSVVDGISDILFKENAGGATASQSPQAVMQSLGTGHSIEGSSRSKLENAFGKNFSGVEIHTDSHAAQLSKEMNARAFTVGNHIAFASGEHMPGTLTGDALMAHELAHVLQQKDMNNSSTASETALEEDADVAAVNAMTAGSGIKQDLEKTKPGIRSGLKLSRCSRKERTQKIMNLDVYELFQHALSPESELEGASAIWGKGCGIKFTMNKKVIDETTTRKLIGDDLEVTYMGRDVPSEDQNNLKGTLGVSNKTFATVFFVKGLAALSQGGTDPLANAIYIGRGKCGPGFTLAHEMGHVLKLGGNNSHRDSSSSLMTTTNCNDSIDSAECDAVRGE
jgi:Domain of unknown function (DUF4157)